jgi:hypothetical protein
MSITRQSPDIGGGKNLRSVLVQIPAIVGSSMVSLGLYGETARLDVTPMDGGRITVAGLGRHGDLYHSSTMRRRIKE